MNSQFNKIQTISQAIIYKNLHPLGWAKTKLYRKTIAHQIKLIIYSLAFTIRPIAFQKKGRTSIFIWASSAKKNRHTSKIIENFVSATKFNRTFSHELTEQISIKSLFQKIKLLASALTKINNPELNLIEKITFASCTARGIHELDRLIEFFKKNQDDIEIVFTFCDAIGFENLIAQSANEAGIKTATLQHGQYRILDSRNMSPDAEAYANFESNLMLCWGQETIDELEKAGIEKSRFFPVGRLLIPNSRQSEKNHPTRQFGLILAGENQADSNKDLISFANQVAEKINYNYSIRLHPSNHHKNYSNLTSNRCTSIRKITNNQRYFDCHDFSIMTMSGLFLDCIEAQHPFLFFDNGSLADVFVRSGLSVRSTESIEEKLSLFSTELFSRLSKKYNDNINQAQKIQEAIQLLCSK